MNDLNPSSRPHEGTPDWAAQPTDNKDGKVQADGQLQAEGTGQTPKKTAAETISDIKSTIKQAQQTALAKDIPDVPKLVPAQLIRFAEGQIPREQLLNIALTTLLDVAEEMIKLIPDTELTTTETEVPELGEGEVAVEGEEPMQPREVQEQAASGPVKKSAEKEKPVTKASMAKYLAALSMVAQEIKNMEMEIRAGLEGKGRNMQLALATIAELKGPETVDKQLLITQLEGLKESGKNISTGYRIILGEHPDIMLGLKEAGVIPPLAGGGPYDGMAQKMAASGTPPYDNPVYAEMANSIPGGWEELSISEVDQVINQLQQTMTDPPTVRSSHLFSTLTTQTLLYTTIVLKPLIIKTTIVQMMVLQNELASLKSQRNLVMLPPKLALQLSAYGFIPPGTQALHKGMVNQVMQQMDKSIGQQITAYGRATTPPAPFVPFVGLTPIIARGFSPLVDRNVIQVLQNVQRYGFEQATRSLHFFFLSPTQREMVRMVTTSIAITQAIALSVQPPVGRNMPKLAEQTLQQWVGTRQADRIVGDLFGFTGTNVVERALMANAIVSFAVVSTLVSAYRPSPAELLSTLNTVAKIPAFMGFARVAIALVEAEKQVVNAAVEAQKQVQVAALKVVVNELLKSIEADLEKLEGLENLKALILEMMNQIIQMLSGAGTIPISDEDTPAIEPVVPLQG